jgi:Cu+-exporting ATPase
MSGKSAIAVSHEDGVENALTLEIGVEGMTCASCSARLERSLRKRDGVLSAEVQLLQERARIVVVPGTTLESLFDAVSASGFTPKALPKQQTAEVLADEEASFARTAQREGRLLLLSLALALPLVAPMFAMDFGVHWHLPGYLQLALATPVQFVLGARFYRAGAKAALNGSPNMDLLVALGTSSAYFYSVYQLASTGEQAAAVLYFESSAVVIALVRLGKWLESRAKRGTSLALRELLRLRPSTVNVRRSSSQAAANSEQVEQQIPERDLEPGMFLVVRPGERFAADGIVVEGAASVDESMLSGEPLPVQRVCGQNVVGGSLNLNGLVVAQVTRVGDDATLGQIINLIQGAQAGKAKLQHLVDRISAWFVPLVLVLALTTFIGWYMLGRDFEAAMLAAVSVLVIACPCALGLATPTAIVAGTGAAARAGILVRDIDTLEQTSRVDTVVFDKTGTLTEGRPQLIATQVDARIEPDEMLRLAASLEQASTHPFSVAIVQHAKQRGLELTMPTEFEEHLAEGISGKVNAQLIRVGQLSFLGRCGVQTAGSEPNPAIEGDARATVGVARGNELLGRLTIRDELRKTAQSAIAALKARGIHTVLLSGDDERVVEQLGAQLGIRQVVGRARPEQKQQLVAQLKAEGRIVAMVGDGINDAPALAAADVGIAIGSGTDVAVQTANVVIMRADLRLTAASLEIATATFRKIRQNLFWAFVYNCVGIPLAASGRLTPMMAGLAMAMSSVCVVTNSLLLRRWRPHTLQLAYTNSDAP